MSSSLTVKWGIFLDSVMGVNFISWRQFHRRSNVFVEAPWPGIIALERSQFVLGPIGLMWHVSVCEWFKLSWLCHGTHQYETQTQQLFSIP
eukprot:515598-Amphidinium_carterae.1